MMNAPTPHNDDTNLKNSTPPAWTYVPVVPEPPVKKREKIIVTLVAYIGSCLLHVAAFCAVGFYIDYRSSQFDIELNWSDEPLTGFGMGLDSAYFAEEDADEPLELPPPVEREENPFDSQTNDSSSPQLDPDSIQIAQNEPDEPQIDESKPIYDLARDPKKLNAVKADVASMPNLHVLAPGNARIIVLIRNDRVKGSRFESSIRRLFLAFPDYKFTLGASDIDPILDIDALLIATANPKLYAETFLVASHHIPPEKLHHAIQQAFPTRLNWRHYNERPLAVPDSTDGQYNPRSGIYKRAIYLPDDQTVLFLKPEVLPSLNTAHVDAIVATRDQDLSTPEQKQTFLQSLGTIGNGDSLSAPTLFFMLQGIENIYLGAGFPKFNPPKALMASLSTADQPHVNLQATFASEEDAKQFASLWPQITHAASNLGIPGVGVILNALSLTPEKEQLFVTGDLNGAMISLVLMFVANYLNRND